MAEIRNEHVICFAVIGFNRSKYKKVFKMGADAVKMLQP